jgi:hypothetical protein
LKGCVATFQATSPAVASQLRFLTPASAMRSGITENRKMLSKTKMSTTGALAAGPIADRMSGGPM